jgi:hypothetical protein
MTEIVSFHKPNWQLDGTDWHMVVGNRSVAQLNPNHDPAFPRFK